MNLFKARILVIVLAIAAIGFAVSPPVAADSPIRCNSGSLVNATLKVDGVATAVNNLSDKYALIVCRDERMSSYMVQLGLQDFGVLKEELTVANSEKVYEVTFTPTAGDKITVAEFYGRVQSFDVGTTVVVSVRPTPLSKVDDAARACERKDFTDATCIARPATRDLSAFVTGYVRFDFGSSMGNYSKLKGTTISASVNMFELSLSGPCPAGLSGSSAELNTTLVVKMYGPHFKYDGSTLNVGALEISVPKDTITECFGGSAEELESSLSLTRTEGAVTDEVKEVQNTPSSSLQYRTTISGGALKISVSAISFSSPTYRVKMVISPSVISTPKSETIKLIQLSRTSSKSASAIAALTTLKVTSGSKISMKVDRSTAKFCKVTGSSIKGLKAGTCKVTVTVKPSTGKSKSEAVSLLVM